METSNRPKLRWVKWWHGDWRKDATLRMCSLAARGLWMEMLGIMHEAEPYGHLLVNGRKPTARQMASLVGASEAEVLALIEELKEAGVYSITSDGVPYSRRMIRDRESTEIARAHGSTGGNPALTGRPKEGVNPPDKDGVKLERERDSEEEKEPPLPPESRGAGNVVPFVKMAEQSPVTRLPADPPRTKRGRVRNGSAEALRGFEQFYAIYPRKVGEGAAEKAWPKAVAACGGDWTEIVDGLNARLHLLQAEHARGFCPHPSTWLNRRGWKDEVPGAEDLDDTPRLGQG